jgi:hypothetical protein
LVLLAVVLFVVDVVDVLVVFRVVVVVSIVLVFVYLTLFGVLFLSLKCLLKAGQQVK